jgi:hypothetical protein
VGGTPLNLWEVLRKCRKLCGQGVLRTPHRPSVRPTDSLTDGLSVHRTLYTDRRRGVLGTERPDVSSVRRPGRVKNVPFVEEGSERLPRLSRVESNLAISISSRDMAVAITERRLDHERRRRRSSVVAIRMFGTIDAGTDAIETASRIATACTKNSVIETLTIAYDASETPSPRSCHSFRTCGRETS